MHISLCAKSKILQLTGKDKCFRIKALDLVCAGSEINLVPDPVVTAFDVTINHLPLVIIDQETIEKMLHQDIDFDYNLGTFIISNRGTE